MCQEAYIKKVLERFQMHYCKPIYTSVKKGLIVSVDLYPETNDEKEVMNNVPYASTMGSLMTFALWLVW